MIVQQPIIFISLNRKLKMSQQSDESI